LSFEDFKGMPVLGSSFDAVTVAGPDIYYHEVGDEYYIDSVKTIFDCKKSWMKKEAMSDQLLTHEKIHFDIAEVFVRELKEKYDSLSILEITKKETYDKITSEVMEKKNLMDQEFDKDTNNGQYHLKQVIWEEKITNLLN
jgi:hypothetical protein